MHTIASFPTKAILQVGLSLAVTALVGTSLMALTYHHARDYILENQRLELIKNIHNVLPDVNYNNAILNDAISVTQPHWLGSTTPMLIYRARLNDDPVAVVLSCVAPNGYSGAIKLVVGVRYNGEISGVRVVQHRETPGLGDAIEVRRSNWIFTFSGRSELNTPDHQWRVVKDGGEFDQLTGATITSRAIVKAVHRALRFFAQNKHQLFNEESISLN